MMNYLRNVPVAITKVFLHLHQLKKVTVLNMNILDHMNVNDINVTGADPKPYRFIAPLPESNQVPQDGLLQFATIETLSDLLAPSPANTVLMFRDDQRELLEVLVKHTKLFDFEPIVLTGIPEVAYSPEFENDTWELTRAAYHATVNDLAEDARKRAGALADKEDSTIYGREQKQITRSSGHVKEFKAFDMPVIDPMGDTGPAHA